MNSDENSLLTEEQKKEAEFFDAILNKLKEMSQEEQHQTFVDAGIVNQEGELTTTYGGTAEPEEG